MTRFARSKGSKASNERVEEEATPWEQLKAPQTNSKKHFDVEDLDDDIDFKEEDEVHASNSDSEAEQSEDEKSNVLENLKPQEELLKTKKKRQRNKNKCLNCKEVGHMKMECPKLSEERRTELQELVKMKIERKGKGTGRKKKKRKRDFDSDEQNKDPKQSEPSEPTAKKSKLEKSHKKQLKDKTGQLVQEGEGLFQGFRVLEKDVHKLRDLVTELEKSKATPAEMKEVLKRERRKAEKALANVKKNVCFQCREPGHRFSDCPQKVEKVGACFKCGSRDHTSRNCVSKLKGADAYKFADCFVCGQKGHLAKACPDNPKGLYPKGGGCRFCGSVEHLKSECPRKAVKDAKIHVTAKMHSHRDNIEEEGDLNEPRVKMNNKKHKKTKVINF